MSGALVFTEPASPVDGLVAHLKAGDSLEQFLDGFPSVSREQAEASSNRPLRRRLMSAEYEWDEAKRRSNIWKHGVDFTMIEHSSGIALPWNSTPAR